MELHHILLKILYFFYQINTIIKTLSRFFFYHIKPLQKKNRITASFKKLKKKKENAHLNKLICIRLPKGFKKRSITLLYG